MTTNMNSSTQLRRGEVGLAATAAGGNRGSWAAQRRGLPQAPLTSGAGMSYASLQDADKQRQAISERLSRTGAVPATTVESATNPRFTDGIDTWWQQHFERMEQPLQGQAYRVMPDDYTPLGTSGRALSGKRRTHRMRYAGAGVELRMPSATAIRRFSKENGRATFDLPIEMEHEGGRISGFVRVTEGAGGAWDVKPLGFPNRQSAGRAAESVACILEARRPSLALAEAEAQYAAARQEAIDARRNGEVTLVDTGASPLHQRRINRMARFGAALKEPRVRSSFILGGAYDPATGTATIRIGTKSYGYKIPKNVFDEVMGSGMPGRAYNELIKNRSEKVAVTQCRSCRRIYRDEMKHLCPPAPRRPRKSDRYRLKVATIVLDIAGKQDRKALA